MIGMIEPAPQNPMEKGTFDRLARTYQKAFRGIYEDIGLYADGVKKVAELGCGQGPIVQAALSAFSQAHIDAVDAFDILIPEIKSNPRVEFHLSKIIEILESKKLGKLNTVVLRGTRNHHGLNEGNIHLLKNLLDAEGILITDSDNGDIEDQDWFKKQFQQIWGREEFWALRAWKAIK